MQHVAEILAAWCGPAGKDRLLAEAELILFLGPEIEELPQHPAWVLAEAARGHAGLHEKVRQWLETLSVMSTKPALAAV
ncbi:MAG: hypothetical protein AB1486_34510 [Planctomycetota bacterium]